jgi:hypothetical protein
VPDVLLRFPSRFCIRALTRLSGAVLFVYGSLGDEIFLELLHRAASFDYEPTEISGHGGELAGTEDDQEEEPYDHHLLGTDTEHEA